MPKFFFSSHNIRRTQAKTAQAYFTKVEDTKTNLIRLWLKQHWSRIALLAGAIFALLIVAILIYRFVFYHPVDPKTKRMHEISTLVEKVSTEARTIFMEQSPESARGFYQRHINSVSSADMKAALYLARATSFSELCAESCAELILSDLKQSDDLNPTIESIKLLYQYELKYGNKRTAAEYAEIMRARIRASSQ